MDAMDEDTFDPELTAIFPGTGSNTPKRETATGSGFSTPAQRSISALDFKYPLQQAASGFSTPRPLNQVQVERKRAASALGQWGTRVLSPSVVEKLGGKERVRALSSQGYSVSGFSLEEPKETFNNDGRLIVSQSSINSLLHILQVDKAGRPKSYDGLTIPSVRADQKRFPLGTTFVGTDFSPSRQSPNLGANFTGSSLVGLDFTDARIPKGGFFLADVEGTNFSGTNLTGATFLGVQNLDKAIFDRTTTMPSGQKYDPSKSLATQL
jgi:hypothetical protein